MFARFGYEATTTREIAARAGCAEGLIHRYFGGKSGLLFSLVKLHLAQESVTTIERTACATLEAEIQKLMDWQLDHLWEEREFLCLAFSCGILQPRLEQSSPQIHARTDGTGGTADPVVHTESLLE